MAEFYRHGPSGEAQPAGVDPLRSGVEVAVGATFPLSEGRAAHESGGRPGRAEGETVLVVGERNNRESLVVGDDILAVVFHLERFMTTPRDLLMVAIDIASSHPPEQGDLSLALAGAEVIDLLGVQAIRLDGDRIVPVHRPATGDRLLDEAASSLVRQEPYESVGDWLWRRGRGLFSSYLAALEAEGQVTRQSRRWRLFRTGRMILVDSPAHREASKRWTSDDAVLAALAAAVGIRRERTAESPGIADDAVATVLAAVNAAVTELGLIRQRRAIEEAAFDNIWRGG